MSRKRPPKKNPSNVSLYERLTRHVFPTKNIERSAIQTVSFPCPFCEGTCSVPAPDEDVNPRLGQSTMPAVFHTMPPCKQLVEMEILDFLTAARKKAEEKENPT